VISFETLGSSSNVSMHESSSPKQDDLSSLNDASPQAACFLKVPKFHHSSNFSSSMSGYNSSTDDSMQKKNTNFNDASSMQIQESL
jgi:hypothetical protein